GVRPSLDELDRLEADPAALDGLIDDFLADSRFERRVRDLFAEVYLTRTEAYAVNFAGFDLDGVPYPELLASVGEEPVRLVAHVAAHDPPITEIVTADYTI